MPGTAKLLDRVAWDSINDQVRREQRNREVYVPPISLFRWWARRPHALMGALIDAALVDQPLTVVSDPFSGGGTVAVEAARRGLPLYAQDLHPWAIAGLASALDKVDPEELQAAVTAVLERIERRCKGLYPTTCAEHGEGSEVVHVFWVRSKRCPRCETTSFLFPYSLLTLASRSKDETRGYFGCSACGGVTESGLTRSTPRRCQQCARRLPDSDEALVPDRLLACHAVACSQTFAAFDGEAPSWKAVLVQRLCLADGREVVHFDSPSADEASSAKKQVIRRPLRGSIPKGLETSLLRRAGFSLWSDLYPPRQLATLLAAADAVDSIDASDAIRARLRLAVCGASEMAGFLSRWDRYYPKAFEAVANHRFPALGFACETNLLARRGRGTIRRRLAQSVAAARWSRDSMTTPRRPRVEEAASARRRLIKSAPLIARGSSARQLPARASVDLVLTDPPYFDDVQYAELASLFLVWARALKLVPSSVTVDVRSEAVANSSRGVGVEEYRSLLTAIFREARRTLKNEGRLVLTYHNTDIGAWWALARALRQAGFAVSALAVADAENSSDHPKRGNRAFTKDLVIECRPTRQALPLSVVSSNDGNEADELRAAGRTVAVGGRLSLADFVARFSNERGRVTKPRIEVSRTRDI